MTLLPRNLPRLTLPLLAVLAACAVLPVLRWWYGHLDDDGAITVGATFVAGVWAGSSIAAGTTDQTWGAALALVASVVLAAVGVVGAVHIIQAAGLVAAAVCSVVLWRRASLVDALPALLLLLLALPARGDLDTFVGFPLRVSAASGAAALLSPAFGAVPRETVLVLEGRVADVEVACAGVSTVWVALAAVALLAHEQHRHRRFAHPLRAFALSSAVTFAVLLVATTLRVAALAVIGLSPALPDHMRQTIGQLVHVPLGAMALVAAVAAGAVVVRHAPTLTGARSTTTVRPVHTGRTGRTGRTVLAAWVLLAMLTLCSSTRPHSTVVAGTLGARSAPLLRNASAALLAQAVPLTSTETALFERHADAAAKLMLPDGTSALLVQARSSTAHHAPERCLASAGHSVVDSRDVDGMRITVLDGGTHLALSFFASAALPDDTTLANTPQRWWLAARARLGRRPAPAVLFVSALWARDTTNPAPTLTPLEQHRAQQLRASINALVHEGLP